MTTSASSWVLRAAFCSRDDFDRLAPTSEALELAERWNLLPRIMARMRGGELALRNAGFELAKKYRDRVVARALQRDATLLRIQQVARSQEIPFALLKGAAITALNPALAQHRIGWDIDLLAPEAQAPRLWRALSEGAKAVFDPTDAARFNATSLPEIERPGLLPIDLHRRLGYLHVSSRSRREGWDWEGLVDNGLLRQHRDLLWLPTRLALVGHLLVHALVQHRWSIDTYPRILVLADFIDLGPYSREELKQLASFHPLLRRRLPVLEILAKRLEAAEIPDRAPEGRLLRQLVGNNGRWFHFRRALAASADLADPLRRRRRVATVLQLLRRDARL